jgi:hypothetical protein
MNDQLINKLLSIGRCLEIIDRLLENTLFDDLSKHNEYWHSEHELEGDKLDETRMSLAAVQEDLLRVWETLKEREEDYD